MPVYNSTESQFAKAACHCAFTTVLLLSRNSRHAGLQQHSTTLPKRNVSVHSQLFFCFNAAAAAACWSVTRAARSKSAARPLHVQQQPLLEMRNCLTGAAAVDTLYSDRGQVKHDPLHKLGMLFHEHCVLQCAAYSSTSS